MDKFGLKFNLIESVSHRFIFKLCALNKKVILNTNLKIRIYLQFIFKTLYIQILYFFVVFFHLLAIFSPKYNEQIFSSDPIYIMFCTFCAQCAQRMKT